MNFFIQPFSATMEITIIRVFSPPVVKKNAGIRHSEFNSLLYRHFLADEYRTFQSLSISASPDAAEFCEKEQFLREERA